jgi:hypothetical protein
MMRCPAPHAIGVVLLFLPLTAVSAAAEDGKGDAKDRVDLSSPKALVKSFWVAEDQGDGEAMKLCSIKPLDPEVLESRCANRKSERAYQAACAKRWSVPNPGPDDFRQPPRTREQSQAFMQQRVIDQMSVAEGNGPETARVSTSFFSYPLRRVGKDWKYDMVPFPYGASDRTGLPKLRVETRVLDEITKEVLDGKYKDPGEASRALDQRTKDALNADPAYQATLAGRNEAGLPAAKTPVPTPGDAAEKLKKIEAGWQSNDNKPADLLADMKGTQVSRREDGTVLITRSGRIATASSFQPTVTFRIIVMTDDKDIRIGYGARQIIFNWEMQHDELRVDGGPPAGKHKPGAGQLPANQWVGIELITKPDELTIYVDGVLRYRVNADFSKVNEPLKLTAQTGDLWVKSITVLRPERGK